VIGAGMSAAKLSCEAGNDIPNIAAKIRKITLLSMTILPAITSRPLPKV
jgi:hypothetical protein